MRIVDRTIGTYHLLFDHVPTNIPEVPPKPRRPNPWQKNGKPIIAKIEAGLDIRKSVDRVLTVLGPLAAGISRGDNVMVKPNFNSDDPLPASTDLSFLRAVIEILLESGARVTIGESSGGIWWPTSGQVVEPGVILASGDLVAIDIEAAKILLGYKTKNRILSDPWQMPQITTAIRHNLGVARDGYVLLT